MNKANVKKQYTIRDLKKFSLEDREVIFMVNGTNSSLKHHTHQELKEMSLADLKDLFEATKDEDKVLISTRDDFFEVGNIHYMYHLRNKL